MLEQAIARYDFNGVPIAAIEHDGDLWMIGKDVGLALGYADPTDAIKKLVARNSDELEKYSAVVKMTVDNLDKGGLAGQLDPAGGGSRDDAEPAGATQRRPVRVFNEEGVMILTMLSSQPGAAAFRAWAVKILKAYRHGELVMGSPAARDSLLTTCIKEARFGNPVAVHTLITRFGYPETIRRELKSDFLRRASRLPATKAPEFVDWFILDFLARLRAEIEGAPGAILAGIRGRPPSYANWKEREAKGARWCLQHRPSDLYTFLEPLAEAEGVEIGVTCQAFGRWLTYETGRMANAGWERTPINGQRGNVLYQLRLVDGA